MARKDFTEKGIIIPAIIVGVVGYMAIKNQAKRKKMQEEEAARQAAEEASNEAEKLTPSTKKPAAPKASPAERAFIDAVRKLQTALGISPTTGFVGDKTKAALRSLKLTDVVTSGNVADLITKVEAAKKAKQTGSKPVVSLSQQIKNAWDKSSSAALIVTETFDFKPKLLDSVRNTWNDKPGAGSRTFTKGKVISKSDGFAIVGVTKTDKIVLKNKAGEFFVLEPKYFLVQG